MRTKSNYHRVEDEIHEIRRELYEETKHMSTEEHVNYINRLTADTVREINSRRDPDNR